MIAIIGLGNPGPEYEATRHNAGFWFVDQLADSARVVLRPEAKFHGSFGRARIAGEDVLLLKPSTFMNRSGRAAQALCQFYKVAPDDVLVAHDELDLPAGTMRLKVAGGHGGHNGLRDLHAQIGPAYRRLRVGIGHPGDKSMVLNYVLGRPSREDEQAIIDGLKNAERAIGTWLRESWDKALQQLHTEK
jgi:peptidyl-tRNA hydrolase, PTH1 family